MGVLEGTRDELGDVGLGAVIHAHVAHAQLGELAAQDVGGVCRVPVHGAVEDRDRAELRLVGGPLGVAAQDLVEVAPPEMGVQGADEPDVELRRLFEQRGGLHAVLAHDVGVVAARLVGPVALPLDLVGEDAAAHGTEGAEGVSREERTRELVVGDHDLGPVDHRGADELEGVAPEAEGVPLLDLDGARLGVEVEELPHELEGLGGPHQPQLGVAPHKVGDDGAVVGLHVVDDHVVEVAPAQGEVEVLPELRGHRFVHAVQEAGLLVEDEVVVV